MGVCCSCRLCIQIIVVKLFELNLSLMSLLRCQLILFRRNAPTASAVGLPKRRSFAARNSPLTATVAGAAFAPHTQCTQCQVLEALGPICSWRTKPDCDLRIAFRCTNLEACRSGFCGYLLCTMEHRRQARRKFALSSPMAVNKKFGDNGHLLLSRPRPRRIKTTLIISIKHFFAAVRPIEANS